MDTIKNTIHILKETGYKNQIIKDIIILIILVMAIVAIFLNIQKPIPIRFFFNSVMLDTEKQILDEYSKVYYPLYYFSELVSPILKADKNAAQNIQKFYSNFLTSHPYIESVSIRNGNKYISAYTDKINNSSTQATVISKEKMQAFLDKEETKEKNKLIWDSYKIVSNKALLNLMYVSDQGITLYYTINFNGTNTNYYHNNSFAYIVSGSELLLIPTNGEYQNIYEYEPIIKELNNTFKDTNDARRIVYKGQAYWGYKSSFITINTTNEIGIFVPEKSIAPKAISPFITASIGAIFIIALIIIFFTIKYIRLIERIRKDMIDIESIIENGENDHTEFKSSMRYDYTEEKYNKCLEDVIMKSIAAFSNSFGGRLIIGISNDKTVLGLENDYNTLKYPDKDHFELHLNTLLQNHYSSAFASSNIKIDFVKIENKDICIVTILKGKEPLYTITTNKQGQKEEKFYIRMGNSSRELSKGSEIYQYCRSRFK